MEDTTIFFWVTAKTIAMTDSERLITAPHLTSELSVTRNPFSSIIDRDGHQELDFDY